MRSIESVDRNGGVERIELIDIGQVLSRNLPLMQRTSMRAAALSAWIFSLSGLGPPSHFPLLSLST